MKIVYFLDLPSGPHSGIGEKVLAQTNVWVTLGHDVLILVVAPSQHYDAWNSVESAAYIKVIPYRSTFHRFISRIRSSFFIWQMKKRKNFILYLRLSIMTPDQIALLAKVPYCLEVNSNVSHEYKLRNLKLIYWVYRLWERRILQGSSCVFFVSQELHSLYSKKFALKKAEFITNGIKLKSRRNIPKHFDFDLVFLATEVLPWHGVERILKVGQYNPTVKILIITKTPLSLEINEKLLRVKNITALNALSVTEIENLVEKCVAGITFASLEKIGLIESAALKTRYYLSHGLPVVSNCKDTAFSLDSRLILILSNEDLDAESRRLLTFINHWRSRRVMASQLGSIDINKLERQKLLFMENVLIKKK